MTRHFLRLYLLVIVAIAAVSWTQEKLWLAYSTQNAELDSSLTALLSLTERQLRAQPPEQRVGALATWATDAQLAMELLTPQDIAGASTLSKLAQGQAALMQAGHGESWLLKQIDAETVLAIQYREPAHARGVLEWLLALLLYAVLALALMLWIWPLTRDLRALQTATASFGNRNWIFRADINPRSQVFPLAETFRKMAARIDGLIGSHKDLSNAVAHEIKTPLARMQFEIEAAQRADSAQVRTHLGHIKDDIAELNGLVRATLDYAVLERADMALNIAQHDFTKIVPAVVDAVRRDAQRELHIDCMVAGNATSITCDIHLIETALRNLLYNASRYARERIRVSFLCDSEYLLCVEDDGPGVQAADRQRVFESFVQLDTAPTTATKKTGFGLGLAIVKRIAEWHGGAAKVATSPLGGAAFQLTWPRAHTDN